MQTTLTSKGQITLPIVLRKQMGLKKGSKVFFVVEGYQTRIMSKTEYDLNQLSLAGRGLAKEYKIKNEEEMIALIKKNRKFL
jgi:AbrB family looped-hinge helix DNA binding protein